LSCETTGIYLPLLFPIGHGVFGKFTCGFLVAHKEFGNRIQQSIRFDVEFLVQPWRLDGRFVRRLILIGFRPILTAARELLTPSTDLVGAQ